MMRAMWFGTKQFSRWIKVHSPGSDHPIQGYSERLDFLNGGVAIRESITGHLEYALTWSRISQDEARQITDFAYGLFGSAPYYLSEPSSMDQNVLNKTWSAPGLTTKDGIPLAGSKRPSVVPNPDQSQGYPIEMAKYTLSAADTVRKFYVPIPPGHTARVGAHGDTASTLQLRVQPTVKGVASASPTDLAVLSTATATRFNGTFTAAGEQAGIEISIKPGSAGTITLAGIMVQVIPSDATPALSGPFISGQGAGGLSFEGRVAPTPYSFAHNSWGLAVKLVETEDWR